MPEQRGGTARAKTGHGPNKDGARSEQRRGTVRTKTGHGPKKDGARPALFQIRLLIVLFLSLIVLFLLSFVLFYVLFVGVA